MIRSTLGFGPAQFAAALLSGGDERLLVGPDGLNKYGCAPRPRSAVEFGSCTSSTISERGHRAAYAAWRKIVTHDESRWVTCIDEMMHDIRARLLDWLGHPTGLGECVLSPSGTDAELLAVHIVQAAGCESLLNIVVAPDEVGSGTLPAASGFHFAEMTPSGRGSNPGSAINDHLVRSIRSIGIDVRTANGDVRSSDDIRDEITRHAKPAIERGSHVIIHCVAHSKTGIRTPAEETIDDLQGLGENVHIVVDAAQGRLSKESMARHLDRGRMLLFTGSKFYGGPTFSGALLVPKRYHGNSRALPAGYGDYFTRAELPSSWHEERASLNERTNLGLALRWNAALEEMFAMDEIDEALTKQALRLFAESVTEAFAPHQNLKLITAACATDNRVVSDYPLEDVSSVFNFSISNDHGEFDRATLKRWHGWLNRSLTGFIQGNLSESDARIADREFHLGQPVLISPGAKEQQKAVLRVALGAPLLCSLVDKERSGLSPERSQWLKTALGELAAKIEILGRFNDRTSCP